jgi:hypothetical protein
MDREYEGYLITTAENTNYKRIRATKQGSIPTRLSGLYTTEGEAKKAIDLYKAGLKGKTNGKKQSNG